MSHSRSLLLFRGNRQCIGRAAVPESCSGSHAARALQVDPVHRGVVIVGNIEIGCLTPPVGRNLFAMSAASGLDLRAVTRTVLPYAPVAFAILLLIAFVPWLSVGGWR